MDRATRSGDEGGSGEARALARRDTIAAVSTAPGRAAIAVIRVSGPAAAAALAALAGPLPAPRVAAYRGFRRASGELLDRGLALWLPGPGTATGEDVAELHVHGGRAVVAAVLDALLCAPGVRMAEPGEFTRRAFLAGRMDLAEVEGLADLLAAETDAQRRQAALQADGALSAVVEGWRERLVGAMALIEAGIDFSDEDGVPEGVRAQALAGVKSLRAELTASLADGRAERLREGFRVALAGPPNVGKSSLLNALARRDVAIVTDAPGTTRDVMEVYLDLGGLPVSVADTAGIRDAADAAERQGVLRARERVRTADLVLWVEDATSPAPPIVAADRLWRIMNKSDLARGAASDADHVVSARTGSGLEALVEAIRTAAEQSLGGGDGAGLTRERHRDAVGAVVAILDQLVADWRVRADELIAESLRHAATELGRVTGRIGVEDVLDRVFGSFCIGK